jgi:hypothetical protein
VRAYRGAGDLLSCAALYLDYGNEYEAVVLSEGTEAEARRMNLQSRLSANGLRAGLETLPVL